MFMRFLQLKIAQDHIADFKGFYESDVMHELHNALGCLFAGLIKSKPEDNEFISLTFWQTQTQAEKYESSETFRKLIIKTKTYLSESAEWKIQLTKNSELEYGPVEEEPVIKKYIVAVQNEENDEFMAHSSNMFVRVLSLTIQEDKLDEFKKLYSEIVIPTLKTVKGCRYIFLTESVNEKNEFISVTIWDRKEYVDDYEMSGKFQEITDKVKHTFSQLYLWKMSLEKNYGAKVSTSEDFKVDGYNIVTGKSFL
ncbi:MAG: antibiotic biosynthesis monooxygenase family protein [Ignavibacteriaceae bacterium]